MDTDINRVTSFLPQLTGQLGAKASASSLLGQDDCTLADRLACHSYSNACMMSCCCVEVSELEWRQRVAITSVANETATFEFTMRQRLGGLYDGIYYTQGLRAEDGSECARL